MKPQKTTIMNVLAGGLLVFMASNAPAQLLLTQIVDGDLPGGVPKAVEITNIGGSAESLVNIELHYGQNANPIGTVIIDLDVEFGASLAAGDSIVVAATGSDDEVLSITGSNPDVIGGQAINGDDALALVDVTGGADISSGATLIDTYGESGVDANAGSPEEPWLYQDSTAVRNASVSTPNATWTQSEWTITSLDTFDLTQHQNAIGSGATGNDVLGQHTASGGLSVNGWALYE